MKTLLIAMLCAGALLLAAGAAQAFAVYNHTDHEACVCDFWNKWQNKSCAFKVSPHGSHNGEHGAGLTDVMVYYHRNESNCRCNNWPFTIPKGGYARLYDEVIKVYKNDGKLVGSQHMGSCNWGGGQGGKR